MLSELEAEVTRNLLKFAVGQVIFCPGCNAIMDCRRAVMIEVGGHTRVACGTCHDNKIKAALAAYPNVEVKITDGRELFNTPTPAPAPHREQAVKQADVEVGKRYRIRHGSNFVDVTVLATRTHRHLNTRSGAIPPARLYFICRNERTGREIVVKSAAKFRREVA